MINFTVGPVMENESILKIGNEQIPYFRTEEFSNLMFQNEYFIKKFSYASKNSRVVFLTGSGTAAMEASIIGCLSKEDKVICINGGSFGQRFVDLLELHHINFSEIKLEYGKALKNEQLDKYDEKGYTAFVVNIHETSTCVLYNLQMISEFCKKNNLFLIVDAISSFLADKINMKESGIDVLITGSQKALACPPGVSIVVLSKFAQDRVKANPQKCMYLDLNIALKNGERGQTPFTPAVGTLRQINKRLIEIDEEGGIESEYQKIKSQALDFRKKIIGLPFVICSESMSNAATPIHPKNASAYDVYKILKDEYGIWVCPNGGDLAEKIFRVGHIGALSHKDNTILVNAFNDLLRRKII